MIVFGVLISFYFDVGVFVVVLLSIVVVVAGTCCSVSGDSVFGFVVCLV